MASTTHINRSKMGAADLCDGCLAVLLDDSVEEFYEGKMGKNDDTPTLRHVHEEQYREPDYFYPTHYEGEDEYGEEEEDDKDEDKDEGEDGDESEGDVSPDTDELFIAGVPPRRWNDELPDLPTMAEAADVGCQLCQLLREAILRKGVSFEGPIQVMAGYVWGASRSYLETKDDGLVAWRCEVYAERGEGYLISLVDFNVETRNSKYFGPFYAWRKLT
ncbi:HET domain-containing protein [Fusarium sp. Ph1]|nr:HET domain-containing protein [Fusarium sp. Ph1]